MRHYSFVIALLVTMVLGASGVAQEAPVQITFGAKLDCDPMVSPDGKHLAFASNRTGTFNIYMVTFGASGVVQLTQSPKDDRNPNWSHDSRKIVFDSKRTGHGDLYEMSCDGGSGYLQLSDKPDIEMFPAYGKGDAGLLYVAAPKKAIQLKMKTEIVYAEVKGAADSARSLAEGNGARFSPDCRQIVFVSDRTKNNDIWLMGAEGGLQTQLTTDPKDDQDPCFSPDGKHIVFVSNRAGNFDIWVMKADGSDVRQLTSTPEEETQPCWSSGGYIYYTCRLREGHSNILRLKAP